MKHPRLWNVLCLMTICYQLGMSSRYGCLFEKKLCSKEQFCSDDRLFGQCQDSRQARVLYQVSVPVLQRLQDVLKQLMGQGLSWQDDIVQYIISKELSRIPKSSTPARPRDAPLSQSSQPSEKSSSRPRAGVDQLRPVPAQRYLDYVVLSDPPQASLRMQAPLLDPYTYHQYGYQEEEERSLNSLADGVYPRPSSRSGGGSPRPGDRDRQVLQDMLTLYLASTPQSSRHRVAAALSSSPFYQDLDFPLDYSEDYVLQEEDADSRRQHKKAPQDYSAPSGLDDVTLRRISSMLGRYGIDIKDLSVQQLNSLLTALQIMQAKGSDAPDQKQDGAVTIKKTQLMEGSMTHTGEKAPLPAPSTISAPVAQLLPEAPPVTGGLPLTPSVTVGGTVPGPVPTELTGDAESEGKSSKGSGVIQKEETGSQVREEYGYIVTDQRPLSLFDGVRLLETLAERIHLTTSSFINISVVGPALTFRIRQNNQNLTAGDVASKAVAEKTFLESETGLKILQTGVGEVGVFH